jgi:hypothetical protein
VNDLIKEGNSLKGSQARVAIDTANARTEAERQATRDIIAAQLEMGGHLSIFANQEAKIYQFMMDSWATTANFLSTPIQPGTGATITAPKIGSAPAMPEAPGSGAGAGVNITQHVTINTTADPKAIADALKKTTRDLGTQALQGGI